MIDYTNEYAAFPNGVMTLHNFKDITDEVADLINQIQALRQNGKYGEAAKLIRENSDKLHNRIVTAEWFRTIEEEIRNTQIYSKKSKQYIYTDENEPGADNGDVWIGGE